MAQKFINNFTSTLQGPVAVGATTVRITEGDAARLGVIASGDYYAMTLSNGAQLEVIHVTAYTPGIGFDTLIVERGKESFAPIECIAGDLIEARDTAGTYANFIQKSADAGVVTDTHIGDRTVNDALASPANTGKLTPLLSWITGRLKAVTGKADWLTSPSITLEATKAHVDAVAPHSGHAVNAQSVDDTLANPNSSGTVPQILSWIAGRLKAVTGKSDWKTAPAITLEATKTHVDAVAPHTGHAALEGSGTQVFSVANASGDGHAVNRITGDGRFSAIAHQNAAAPHSGHAASTHSHVIANLPAASDAEAIDGSLNSKILTPANWGAIVTNHNGLGGFKNLIINGSADISQRGDLGSSSGYSVDRWRVDFGVGGAGTWGRSVFGVGYIPFPDTPKYYFSHSRTIAANVGNTVLSQYVEDIIRFSGVTLTLSFWAKVQAGTKAFNIRPAQFFGSGGSPQVECAAQTINLTTTWQKIVFTFLSPSISGKTVGPSSYLNIRILEESAFSTFAIYTANFQLEYGSVATPFEKRPISIEMSLCKRYLLALTGSNFHLRPTIIGASALHWHVPLSVPLRSSPSLFIKGVTDTDIRIYALDGMSISTGWGNPLFGSYSTTHVMFSMNKSGHGLPDANLVIFPTGMIGFDAEL